MSADSMKYAVDKVVESGNKKVMITERGTQFGYNDLIVDFRGISELKKIAPYNIRCNTFSSETKSNFRCHWWKPRVY